MGPDGATAYEGDGMRYVLAAVISLGALAACSGGQKSCDSVMSELNARLDQYGRDQNFQPVKDYEAAHGADMQRCNLTP